ncbi:MAG: hypothetical protein ABF483_01545 [Liquorilactobacillus nagelii]|jgi:K+ transporter|uniref:hypothetical protein n=1 Tax=Liquorilactobacillus nagelii TaxID=82688 RepID=UPI0007098B0B|nr:hypothetical protein [Liquorilactobacillus nagelii]MCC7616095.1 hypothetical protein [Liquorilactobacillus nagelii]MCI1699662.1 hypothetical protein [Liquorilactobacillus nagelii]MCP9314402.1 hypothetical protein [Liquorilactobacillus nagelii]QYH54523.1 hypothetical protein G6O73_07450 [Liquorilactobacillus nagelii DSM 13675]ULQ48466.1 hypothetical protein J6864_05545 [Liquorilactobacillus nagelii]
MNYFFNSTKKKTNCNILNSYNYQKQLSKDRKSIVLLALGWGAAIISIFSPAIGCISIISGLSLIKKHRKFAGCTLVLITLILVYIGLSGFSDGFIAGIQKK